MNVLCFSAYSTDYGHMNMKALVGMQKKSNFCVETTIVLLHASETKQL